MKNKLSLLGLTGFLFSTLAFSSLHAEETLWNLDFKNLTPGQAPAEVAYAAPCDGPQKVTTDTSNTLTGGPAVGALMNPLLFNKETNTHYTPSMTLKGSAPLNSGVITISFDLAFDHVNPTVAHPVETLMAFPLIAGDGGSPFIIVVAYQGDNTLVVGGTGLAKGPNPALFKVGEVAHLKAVLDLNQHTVQVFFDDVPIAEAAHDDTKFSSFLGFTVRDGTALGGNNGATFTAGIGNLLITHG